MKNRKYPSGNHEQDIKSFPFKMDSVSTEGSFSGYAAVFGNIDLGGDIIERGAFKKTLNDNQGKVPLLDHHDPQKQIGWNVSAMEDGRGLLVQGKLNLQVQGAREKHALMKQALEMGARMGLSIGFRVIREELDKKDPNIRRLKEIQLLEYSIVTFPMNPSAQVTGVKGRRDSLHQFLSRELGLPESQADRACETLTPFLQSAPAKIHAVDSEYGAEDLEPLKRSLNHLIEQLTS